MLQSRGLSLLFLISVSLLVSELLNCSVEHTEPCVVPDLYYANILYTVRLPASTELHLHVDESVRFEQNTKPIVSPVHHLSAEIKAGD